MGITFEYRIERDEGDRTVTFEPKIIPKELPNLCLIEGPNSSGKSTILHIIAAGLYGSDLKNLDDGLRAKVNSMISAAHQNSTFSFEIEGADRRIIRARKERADRESIVVEEVKNGKRALMSRESFEREYRLIYDIPDDPTRRMIQIIDEIDAVQRTYGGIAASFRREVERVVLEIKNARNPNRLAELKDLLVRYDLDIDAAEEKFAIEDEIVTKLTRFRAVNSFLEAATHVDKLEQEGRSTKRTLKRGEKVKSEAYKSYSASLEELGSKCTELDELHGRLTKVFNGLTRKKDKHKVQAWERISFSSIASSFEVDPTLLSLMGELRILIREARGDPAYGKELERAKIFAELERQLRQFVNFEETLPGTDKTVKDLLDALSQENYKNQLPLTLAQNWADADKDLQRMSETLKELKSTLPRVLAARNALGPLSADAEIDEDSTRLDDLEMKTQAAKRRRDELQTLCIKLGVDDSDALFDAKAELDTDETLDVFRSLSDPQLLEAIEDHSRERGAAEHKRRTRTEARRIANAEYEMHDKKKPHPYADRLPDLDQVRLACSRIEVNLTQTFQRFSSRLRSGTVSTDTGASDYSTAIGRFMAARIGKIRHVDGIYEIDHVDLASGLLITKEKRQIRLSDMGTGQSMSAYLLALLSSDDSRPVIALFDEVAMMDESSLTPVFDKMREMKLSGKLLAGLVVQRSDTAKIRAI